MHTERKALFREIRENIQSIIICACLGSHEFPYVVVYRNGENSFAAQTFTDGETFGKFLTEKLSGFALGFSEFPVTRETFSNELASYFENTFELTGAEIVEILGISEKLSLPQNGEKVKFHSTKEQREIMLFNEFILEHDLLDAFEKFKAGKEIFYAKVKSQIEKRTK